MDAKDWMTEMVGWIASLILILTISRQVLTQWRTRSTQGVSHWLFIGQCAASTGFVIYSALLSNWVFVSTNVFLLVTAVLGQVIYRRNRRLEASAKAHTGDAHADAARDVGRHGGDDNTPLRTRSRHPRP